MAHRSAFQKLASAALAAVLFAGCSGSSDPLPPPPPPEPDGDVFLDNFGDGVSFQAFAGVPAAATIEVDMSEKYAGIASLKVNVPAGEGAWNGGAFPSENARDLTSFDALTFRVRASRAVTLDVVGFGNDNTGESLYEAARKAVPVTTEWTEVVIPIPLPAKLGSERGLFHFAEAEAGGAFSLWFDEVKFVALPAGRLGPAEPSIGDRTFTLEAGASKPVDATTVTFAVDGVDVVVETQSSWFAWQSSDTAVATVDATGMVAAKAPGTATVTAQLGDVEAAGAVSVVVGQANVPAEPAPMPTVAAADVLSLYSDAYANQPITTLGTDWSNGGAGPRLTKLKVAGDETLKLEELVYAGIEFTGEDVVDATEMTHFHVDVWTHDAAVFKVKLVDFGANGVYDGPGVADDTEQEWTFDAASTPALEPDGWVSIDVPITTLPARGHLAQLILSSDESTVFVDNLYFFAGEVVEPPPPAVPTTAAPVPTEAAENVIALFSEAYTPVGVTLWSTSWDDVADPVDVTVAGGAVKKYANLATVGIEFVGEDLIDATGMEYLHLDVWTPDMTELKVKLVDFGANGAWEGPGVADDAEHEWIFTPTSTPALAREGWVSIDVPLADLPAIGHLAQLIFASATPGTLYVDNLYFHGSGTVEPPPPPPPADELPVIFGDGYAQGVTFAPFGGSNNVLTVDEAEYHEGEASLRIAVPAGGYTGGAFVASAAQDLSGYDAVTFWAKASRDAVLDKVGLANDAASDALFAERVNLALTTTWQKFVLPIPLPSKLVAERGLFHFAEGDAAEYTIWIDDVRYETLDSSVLGTPSAGIATEDAPLTVGQKRLVNGMVVNFQVDGANVSVTPLSRAWFTWASSDETVATVDAKGEITANAEGEASITAKLGAVDVGGVTKAVVSAPPAVTTPEAPATAPTHAPADVVSMSSDVYSNVAVTTWSAGWDQADVADVEIAGDHVKKYTNVVFAGIEGFSIDASAMNSFHLDVWSPDATEVRVKLVDFGANGTYEPTSDNSEHELTFAIATGEWVTLDIPLADFANMTGRAYVSQLIISSSNATLFLDNLYFHE